MRVDVCARPAGRRLRAGHPPCTPTRQQQHELASPETPHDGNARNSAPGSAVGNLAPFARSLTRLGYLVGDPTGFARHVRQNHRTILREVDHDGRRQDSVGRAAVRARPHRPGRRGPCRGACWRHRATCSSRPPATRAAFGRCCSPRGSRRRPGGPPAARDSWHRSESAAPRQPPQARSVPRRTWQLMTSDPLADHQCTIVGSRSASTSRSDSLTRASRAAAVRRTDRRSSWEPSLNPPALRRSLRRPADFRGSGLLIGGSLVRSSPARLSTSSVARCRGSAATQSCTRLTSTTVTSAASRRRHLVFSGQAQHRDDVQRPRELQQRRDVNTSATNAVDAPCRAACRSGEVARDGPRRHPTSSSRRRPGCRPARSRRGRCSRGAARASGRRAARRTRSRGVVRARRPPPARPTGRAHTGRLGDRLGPRAEDSAAAARGYRPCCAEARPALRGLRRLHDRPVAH